ncbi:hypothetical protein AKO1_012872 [Acrasis kona]|uniref:Uncharacterized protein n=1 Tax=Acrasis kona TaxID=1008807 RepID=A0AAW2YWB3_9EUKA
MFRRLCDVTILTRDNTTYDKSTYPPALFEPKNWSDSVKMKMVSKMLNFLKLECFEDSLKEAYESNIYTFFTHFPIDKLFLMRDATRKHVVIEKYYNYLCILGCVYNIRKMHESPLANNFMLAYPALKNFEGACKRGQIRLIEYLTSIRKLNVKKKPDVTFKNVLFQVCERGEAEVFDTLIREHYELAPLSQNEWDSLMSTACSSGNMDVVMGVVEHCVNLQAALENACRRGHCEVIYFIIDEARYRRRRLEWYNIYHWMPISLDYNKALLEAMLHLNVEAVKVMIENGADANKVLKYLPPGQTMKIVTQCIT